MQEGRNPKITAIFFNNFIPLYACIGPLLFMYVQCTLNDSLRKLNNKCLIHLLPFIIFLLDIAPYLFSTFDFKVETVKLIVFKNSNFGSIRHLFFTDIQSAFIRNIINLAYVIYAIVLLFQSKIKFPISLKQYQLMIGWLRFLLISNGFIFILKLGQLITIINVLNNPVFEKLSTFLLNFCWGIHATNVVAIFFFPNILYSLPQNNLTIDLKINEENKIKINKSASHSVEKKIYKPFELENNYLEKIQQIINEYILTHPYTMEKFSLSVLTSDSKIPMHHLNYFFKEHLNTSFNHWKNDLKIKYSCDLINTGILETITFETLATQCGFKSYSNFFTVFKEHLNMTPSEYVQSIKMAYLK